MPNLRTAIAAGTTVLALGGLTALAVGAGGRDAAPSSAGKNAVTTAAPSAPPAEVRTVVVTKVIHRTRRAKAPRRPTAPTPLRAAAAPAPAPVVAPVAAPVPIATRSAPVPRPPVTVHHAGGGDDGGDDGAHSDD